MSSLTPRPRLLPLAAMAAVLIPAGIASAQAPPADSYRFTAVYLDPSAGYRIAEFTPEGPLAGTLGAAFRWLPDVAVNPRGPTYYGSAPFASRIDPATAAFTRLPDFDPNLYSHPSGLTFDTRRNRLVASTFGGVGHLLAYDPEQKTWSELADLARKDVHALTYSAADDTLYGLTDTGILKYTPEGEPAGSVPLVFDIPGNFEVSRYQLVATNDRLAIITAPVTDLLNERIKVQHAYLIDPDTGAVISYGPVQVTPEPGAAALAVAAAGLLRRRRRIVAC